MSIALVQSAVAASSDTCAFGSNNAAGNLLVAVLQDSADPAGITLSDTTGNTWAKAVGLYASGNLLSISIWYAANSLSGANTVTVAGGFGASFVDLAVAEYSGVATSSPLDKTSSDQNSVGDPDSGATATTSQAAELLIAGIAFTGLPTVTWTGSFTGRQTANNGSNRQVNFADRVVSSTGAYDATATLGSSADWMAAIATFKAASGAAGGVLTWFRGGDMAGGFQTLGL